MLRGTIKISERTATPTPIKVNILPRFMIFIKASFSGPSLYNLNSFCCLMALLSAIIFNTIAPIIIRISTKVQMIDIGMVKIAKYPRDGKINANPNDKIRIAKSAHETIIEISAKFLAEAARCWITSVTSYLSKLLS